MSAATSLSEPRNFVEYHRIAAEYRECVLRCQQATDQLHACEDELRTIAAEAGVSPQFIEAANERPNPAIGMLSERELQVFMLIGQGMPSHHISERLGLAGSTVETYRERIKQKLNLPNGNALTRQAVLWLGR